MSNLYKQYFVQNQTENARIINSNEILEARMAKMLERRRVEQEHQEELARNFEAGIVNDATDVIEETETGDELALAKTEAERILNEAKTEAETIRNEACREAENLREEAYTQGYADGNAAIQKELQERQMQMETAYSDRSRMLEADYIKKRAEMEHDLVDVILEVFNKVFHIQFDNKKDILMHLINDAILNIEGDRKFRIKVADSNVLFLENHREDILERVGHGIELEFIADSGMDGNDCLIETDSGVFDCSLGTQLENLIKDIRSLCS